MGTTVKKSLVHSDVSGTPQWKTRGIGGISNDSRDETHSISICSLLLSLNLEGDNNRTTVTAVAP